MIFIEGKFIGKTADPVWDTINLWFEFDLPNGEKYRTRFSAFNDSSTECWVAYDEEKGEIAFIRSRKGLKQAKANLESEMCKAMRKELRKEMKSDIALHYLPNSTVPDDDPDVVEEYFEGKNDWTFW